MSSNRPLWVERIYWCVLFLIGPLLFAYVSFMMLAALLVLLVDEIVGLIR